MEPEKSTVHQSQPLDQRIAPANVFMLVRHDRIQLLRRPFVPVFGQNHNRMKPSHRDGRRALGTDPFTVLESCPLNESMRSGGSDCQPGEEREYTEPVNGEQET